VLKLHLQLQHFETRTNAVRIIVLGYNVVGQNVLRNISDRAMLQE
jgi:hypothetical protein